MIENCLQRMEKINPGDAQFYMWIRRLFDTIDLRVHIDSIYMKKRDDLIRGYQEVMPLIYTCFERFLSVEDLIHPQELSHISPNRVVDMTKDYNLNTIDGVIESVSSIVQLLEMYVDSNSEGKCRFIDLFYIAMYQLLFNLYVIVGKRDKLKEYDVRGAVYAKSVRP